MPAYGNHTEHLIGATWVDPATETLILDYQVPQGDCALFIYNYKFQYFDGCHYRVIIDDMPSYLEDPFVSENFQSAPQPIVVERYIRVWAVNVTGHDEVQSIAYPDGCPEKKYMHIAFMGSVVWRSQMERRYVNRYLPDMDGYYTSPKTYSEWYTYPSHHKGPS